MIRYEHSNVRLKTDEEPALSIKLKQTETERLEK